MEVCTVGGFEEVGKNMTAVKIGEDVIIFDAGVDIPSLIDMQGDENIHVYEEKHLRHFGAVPDDRVLDKLGWTKKVRAIVVGHAHLDHVGAIPYLAYRYPGAVIMGAPFTMEVLKAISQDERKRIRNKIISVRENSSITVRGKTQNYKVDFIRATHSTLQSSFIALHTKEGVVFYALDFKMDDTPVMGAPPNYKKIKEVGRNKVKLLIVNALYSGSKGRTQSESVAKEKLRQAMASVKNRNSAFFVSTFSSHIVRLNSIVSFAKRTNRKIIVLGRSMNKYISCAEKIGKCPFSKKVSISKFRGQINSVLRKVEQNRGKYLVICTGHQAEEGSILDRVTHGQTPFKFRREDNLIFSSKVIPVKENLEARAEMDSILKSRGVRIQDNVHVSGHGSEEDIKMLIKMLKPEIIIPTHGTRKQELPAVNIAEDLGYKQGKNVFLSSNGKLWKF